MLFDSISVPPFSHFVTPENDVFREYKIGTFGKNELKTKYNKKFISKSLDLLTFKLIVLLEHFYILCSLIGKRFSKSKCFYKS